MTTNRIEQEEKLMKVQEFAEFMRVHEQTIRNWIKRGMPAIRVGETFIRIEKEKAISWIKDNK